MSQKLPVYWRGKVIGALLGLLLGKGFWLAIAVGILLGHWVDKTRTKLLWVSQRFYEYQAEYLRYAQQQYQQQQQAGYAVNPSVMDDAYAVLGVSADISDVDLKKQYRRLMSQYHPDKLMAKGASSDELEKAKQKAQAVSVAYERIMRGRKEF